MATIGKIGRNQVASLHWKQQGETTLKQWIWTLGLLALFVPATLMASDADFSEPLPADGGAPFAAYQMRLQAIHAADWEAYKFTAPQHEIDAQIAEAGGETEAEAEFQDFAEFLAMVTPIGAEFVEGKADDQRALFWARTTIRTQAGIEMIVDRDIEMAHAHGRWFLESEHPR